MSTQCKVAVYIGAGLDVRPIRAMKNIDTFVYIDSRPATEFPGYSNQFDKRFFYDFHDKLGREGFEFDNDMYAKFKKNIFDGKPDVMVYTQGSVMLKYYMNTAFPNQSYTRDLVDDFASADTLIIAGHHPHKSIIDLMKTPIDVICWEGTWYGPDEYEDNKDSVVRTLYNDMSSVRSIQYYQKQYVATPYKHIADVEKARR